VTPEIWPCPLPAGGLAQEYALTFDQQREKRLLIVPALYDEANRMRRFTVETMRRLNGAGIDCFLPDLPGTNESCQALENQDTEDWCDAMSAAAGHFGATHVLGIRGGCLFTPADLPRWHYAPAKGALILRQMIRARILASREAGTEETSESLIDIGLVEGLELAGHRIGPDFLRVLQTLQPEAGAGVQQIPQDMIGGSGLWLRAEPDDDRTQADALAAVIAMGLSA